MPMKIKCPHCTATFNVAESAAGKKVSCPKCEADFLVRAAAGGAPRGPAAAPPKTGVKPGPARAHGKSAPAAEAARKPVPRPRDDDEDQDDAPSPPKKKGSPVAMILGIVGGVFLLMCLGCFGAVGYAYYAGVSWLKDLTAGGGGFPTLPGDGGGQATKPGNGGNPGKTNIVFDPFKPGAKVTNIDEALAAIKSDNTQAQQSGADWLAKAKLDPARQTEVARALDPLVASDDANLRNYAVRALPVWADKESLPALVKALDGDKAPWGDDTLRNQGFKTIVRFKDERGGVAVARYLHLPFGCDDATKALTDMGPESGEKGVLSLYNTPGDGGRHRAREILKGFGTRPEAIHRQCLQDVKGTDLDYRRFALRSLAEAKQPTPELQPEVAKTLDGFLTSTDRDTREPACQALGVWGGKENVPSLLKLVDDPAATEAEENMCRLAIEALGKLKDERAARSIIAKLTDQKYRGHAERALTAMGTAAEKELKAVLATGDDQMRIDAARLLKMGGSRENPDLLLALGDLKSPDAQKRRRGASWFVQQKTPDKERQAEAAKVLEATLIDPEPPVRIEAARALVHWATPESSKTLLKQLNGQVDEQVRQAAIEALGELKDETAIVPICQVLALSPNDRAKAVKALQEIGPKAEPTVIVLLNHQDKEVRKEACKILHVVGTKESLKPLTNLFNVSVQLKQQDVVTAASNAAKAIQMRLNP